MMSDDHLAWMGRICGPLLEFDASAPDGLATGAMWIEQALALAAAVSRAAQRCFALGTRLYFEARLRAIYSEKSSAEAIQLATEWFEPRAFVGLGLLAAEAMYRMQTLIIEATHNERYYFYSTDLEALTERMMEGTP